MVRSDDHHTVFSYWHVVPSVRDGQRVTAYASAIGRIGKGWGHVHFAESRDGVHLNPLRRGALGPYRDGTRPHVKSIVAARGGLPTHFGH
jgi:hypothetical protein